MISATEARQPGRLVRNRIRPLRAVRALRNLANSGGKDLPQGVAFLRATEGDAARRALQRLRNSGPGRAVLDRPSNFISRTVPVRLMLL
jgi:hypothetical protein